MLISGWLFHLMSWMLNSFFNLRQNTTEYFTYKLYIQCIYIYAYIYTHIHIYIHTYIHTYIHMYFIITYSIHTYLHRFTFPLLLLLLLLILILLILILLLHAPDSNQSLVVQLVSSYCINSVIPFHSIVITDAKSTFQCDTSVPLWSIIIAGSRTHAGPLQRTKPVSLFNPQLECKISN